MKTKKARTAAIVVVIALVIALSGTFAWQSISQMARNEATEPTNPGGRLHDDFSGYGATDTKDIYVENFGNQPIYARVRLDEYMEIGEGAGLRGTVNEDGSVTRNPDNKAVPLVAGAKIDDVTTWTTHIPGDAPNVGGETGFTDPGKTFHTYWTWTMGGQDTAGNPDGKTVYMPTFNKNRDSLRADINGTLAGLDKDPTVGEQYDDYHPYAVGDTADRVRDEDTEHYPNGATYDIDADTDDECGPYGGYGGAGVEGTNYGMAEETHKARETMPASVITMEEYMGKSDAAKADFVGWVYDTDGWAYWSQPIEPGTPTEEDEFATNATGLLLDRVYLEHKPSDAWYYSINAVGQFITADELGRTNTTGFYDPNGGPAPSEEALALLDFIGVDTASVKGAITPSVSVTVNGEAKRLTYAVQGMDLNLSSQVTVADTASPSQNVTWTVSGNSDPDTAITTTAARSAGAVLHVGENEEGPLTLVARSATYEGLKGTLTLIVQPVSYNVTVTPDENAAAILPGGSQGFTATLTSNNPALILPQTFTWTLEGDHVSGTAVTPTDDTSKATLAVAELETARAVTVKATPTDPTYAGVSGTAAIRVTKVTYMVDIQNEEGTSVTDSTVTIKDGHEITFNKVVSSYPDGQTPTDHWTWSSSDETGKIDVDNGTVSVAYGVTDGTTATITVTNSDYTPALEASFTVNVQKVTFTVTVDPATPTVYPGKTQEFTASVTADDGTTPAQAVTWSVEGATDTTNTKFDGNILTVGADETAESLTVTATHTATGNTGTATVTVGKPTYILKIKDKDGAAVSEAVEIKQGDKANFTLDITSDPAGYPTPSGTWTWTSAATGIATVAAKTDDTTQATVTIRPRVTGTSVITVQNSDDPSIQTTFTVQAKELWDTMIVDDVEYIILLNDVTVNGKANGESEATDHKAALLLTKNLVCNKAFDTGGSHRWPNSSLQKYLNGTTGSNWLADKPNTQDKAITVTLYTRPSPNDRTNLDSSENKVFLLSSADVFGVCYDKGGWSGSYSWPDEREYTYQTRLPCFGQGEGADWRRITYLNGKATSWFTRSNGSADGCIVTVSADGVGRVALAESETGIRPAFWYCLDE